MPRNRSTPMPAYRAVLFDFFGTLTRATRRGRRHAEVAAILGCAPDVLADVLDSSFYLRATGALGDAVATLRWVCEKAGGRPDSADLAAAARARVAALWADTRLRPEALTVLRAVRRRGVRTALVTDCTHELPVLLPRLPVAPLLDARVFSVEVGACKPDPTIYLAACRRLRVTPTECLYVGDGDSQELSGAARTGMTAVRLAAADLDDHLVFNGERGWRGPTLGSLAGLLDLLDGARPGTARAFDAAGCGM
jgi:haloacid dehalogenase superfamily, subfamily IA, variant 3 with third motif having DD or ED